jgi:hypothetical protein
MANTKKKQPQSETPESPVPPADSVIATPTIITDGGKKKMDAPKAMTSRKGMIWVWVVVGIVLISGGAVAWMVMDGAKPATNSNTTNTVANENTNVSTLVARNIDGVKVEPGQEQPRLFAVMIENSLDARPLSSVNEASVVYEALAEGGITRYMAVFPETVTAKEIGPVRSARPYYVSYASAYHPLYIHAGGSPQALSLLGAKSTNVVDFNQFTNGKYFWRDTKRYAPHNLYTSGDRLRSVVTDLKKDLTSAVTPWTYKEEVVLADRPATTKPIEIAFSSLAYRATFFYDRENNQYKRKIGTTEEISRDGKAVIAKNVVVMYVPTTLYPNETKRLKMSTVGKGKAIIFRDGEAIVGTWNKKSDKDRETFLDAAGAPIALNPGMTWVSVIPVDRKVSY